MAAAAAASPSLRGTASAQPPPPSPDPPRQWRLGEEIGLCAGTRRDSATRRGCGCTYVRRRNPSPVEPRCAAVAANPPSSSVAVASSPRRQEAVEGEQGSRAEIPLQAAAMAMVSNGHESSLVGTKAMTVLATPSRHDAQGIMYIYFGCRGQILIHYLKKVCSAAATVMNACLFI
ncbi:hypothetical protein GUJ93_ZPchr0009g531 [Zizania palustris]|uniref:Uncharacterized protein n=1 Tax=Zizania palustris TaxID=103762 RepID=A0A8J5RHJ5_ZIZPA|nr:hypothetical protein GUJ93_ZPchr0009g531 [Zizania palustris]